MSKRTLANAFPFPNLHINPFLAKSKTTQREHKYFFFLLFPLPSSKTIHQTRDNNSYMETRPAWKSGEYTIGWVHPLKLCTTQYQLVNGKLQGKTTPLQPTTPLNAFHTLGSEPLTHFGCWPWRASPEWMSYLSRRCLCVWQRKTRLSFVQLFYCSPTDLLQP